MEYIIKAVLILLDWNKHTHIMACFSTTEELEFSAVEQVIVVQS